MKSAIPVLLTVVLMTAGQVLADAITVDAAKDNWLGNAGCSGNSNRGNGGKYFYSVSMDTVSTDTMVIAWDLRGVALGPGQYVESAGIQFYSAGGGNNFVFDVAAYALKKAWQEGTAGAPGYGGTGYPWGPANVGDCTQNYQIVSATDPDSGGWVALAADGTPWGGLGATGTDDCDQTRPMTTGQWTAVGVGDMVPLGNAISLSADGCGIVEDWITGALDNNGMVIILTGRRDLGNVGHIATREYTVADPSGAPGPYAAELTFNIVPEPTCFGLLGLGLVGLLRRRRG